MVTLEFLIAIALQDVFTVEKRAHRDNTLTALGYFTELMFDPRSSVGKQLRLFQRFGLVTNTEK